MNKENISDEAQGIAFNRPVTSSAVLVKKNEVCYTLIDTFLWSGMDAGVYVKDKVVEWKEDWFTTKEAANKEAADHCKSWGSNLVFLGLEEKIIEGNTYYKPTYNVWD